MFSKKTKKAFTLVELSIVLLVLSFLISGLLVGRRIVERAKVQSLVNDVESVRRVYKLFIDTYGFAPGDATQTACQKFPEFDAYNTAICAGMTSAPYSYGTSITYATTGTKGDGVIQTWSESLFAWRMLEAANLLPRPTTASTSSPSAAIADFTTINAQNIGNDSTLFMFLSGVSSGYTSNATNMNHAQFGPVGYNGLVNWVDKNFIGVTGLTPTTNAFTIRQAINIKTKYDDTTDPYSGAVAMVGASATTSSATDTSCASGGAFGQSSNTTYAQYYTQTPGCRAYFLLD
ncbi:MAG: hypothetical protein RL208_352 [Pseudomonadota bacterium]|jgi:prepilin-type N-terminal cleavage/methylation domain-containing protein